MLLVCWAVTWRIKGTEASAMLGKLVCPKYSVWSAQVDPEFVHVGQQIQLAKCTNKRVD